MMRFKAKCTNFIDDITVKTVCLENPTIAQVNYIALKNAWERNIRMSMLNTLALDPNIVPLDACSRMPQPLTSSSFTKKNP